MSILSPEPDIPLCLGDIDEIQVAMSPHMLRWKKKLADTIGWLNEQASDDLRAMTISGGITEAVKIGIRFIIASYYKPLFTHNLKMAHYFNELSGHEVRVYGAYRNMVLDVHIGPKIGEALGKDLDEFCEV